MFKTGFLLDTYEKFSAAIFNQSPVEVWIGNELVDYGGVIISQDKETVQFDDGSYMLKEVHEFRIR
ncbi:hypothetical protein [Cohnella sp. WQ 127256]|uniref:hypothetical protein n=1 Tax=Cohnella sp. WQ 127256 TaxID=2938790 RepID=UPI002118F4D6|nr:hypothetical protein [Cohnella sp. WQ 127256]